MSSRNPNDLTPEMFELWKKFDIAMKNAKISYALTCTARSQTEQEALYAEGRKPLSEVNSLRIIAGLPKITDAENKSPVTWTMNSKHIINQTNPKARAFDIVILKDGKACYDIKVNVNNNDISDYLEAGKIGKSIGLKWGGDFKTPDYPHFEI